MAGCRCNSLRFRIDDNDLGIYISPQAELNNPALLLGTAMCIIGVFTLIYSIEETTGPKRKSGKEAEVKNREWMFCIALLLAIAATALCFGLISAIGFSTALAKWESPWATPFLMYIVYKISYRFAAWCDAGSDSRKCKN